jgi:hypothetical protein
MSFFYLTTIALDVVFGATFWVVSKTTGGIYYLMYGNSKGEESRMRLTDEEVIVNKDILEMLLDRENARQIELKKLTDKIEVLTNCVHQKNNG